MSTKRIMNFLLFIMLLIVSSNVAWPGVRKEQGGKIGIVVTILPLAEFVENIGKNKVDVSVMVLPGSTPHTYEPTPGQLKKMSQAEIFIKVGSGIEFELIWIDKLISLNKNMLVCNSSEGILLRDMGDHHHHEEEEHHHHQHYHEDKQNKEDEDHKDPSDHHHEDHENHHAKDSDQRLHTKDPHVWLSPVNAIIMVRNIQNALIKVDPQNREFYNQNALQLKAKLEGLHQEIKKNLSTLINKSFMVFHPAWGYFASEYGLEQKAVEHCGKEPTAKELANLIKFAKEHNIKVVFASPQYSKKSARVIAEEIKGKVIFIDPLAKDYQKNLQQVTNAFIEGLE